MTATRNPLVADPPPPPGGTLILVVGMHRSGTSMVARSLHAMGANLGKNIDTEPHSGNPHGHWEHGEVWRAQESLLIGFGREWHSSPGPLPSGWLDYPDTEAALQRFAGIARAELASCGHWVVKDPRTSLLLPLWRRLAGRLGCGLRLIRLQREPEDVAESLASRNAMPRGLALRIWAHHQHSIDRDAEGLAVQAIRFEQIMRDPYRAFAALGDFCGLPGAPDLALRAAALADPALWHHRHGVAGGSKAPAALPLSGRVVVVMRTRWRLNLLPRAVSSVLAQTYPHWLLQIVNDGGPPHLVESEIAPFAARLEGRIGILHLQRQFGMEAATNAGIAAAEGEFVAIHDDDDSWSPWFLERMVGWLHATGEGAVVCRSELVSESWGQGRPVETAVSALGPALEQITPADLEPHNLFPPISLLFRRQLLDQVGPFCEALPAVGDWHFNRRVASLGPISVWPETLARWHKRAPSDRLPNSPMTDHTRAKEFVKAWPEACPVPAFFSQLREVRLWDEDWLRANWLPMALGQGQALGPGLCLLRIPSPESAGPRTLHFGRRDRFGDTEELPLQAGDDQPAFVLLNLREATSEIGVSRRGGEIEGLPPGCEVFCLAEPMGSLEDYAGAPRLPDVLCIGAQRSGTTWLHACLQAHPRVWPSPFKEFHQFDWDGAEPLLGAFRQQQALSLVFARARDDGDPAREAVLRSALRLAFPVSHSWENYSATVAAAPADQLVCDFTPAYATLPEAVVAEIARLMPAVKVIFLLRDPVTRAVSGALHALRRAGVAKPSEEELRHACGADGNVARTDYLRALDIWGRHLPSSQMLVLFHEQIASEPERLLARVHAFLELPNAADSSPAQSLRQALNASESMPPWPVLARIKAELSARWLPMLVELEHRLGAPVSQWRRAAEARLRAARAAADGAGPARDNSVLSNLAQWDAADGWEGEGDQWRGQAAACGVPYPVWKREILARYAPLIPRGGVLLEIGPGHGRWSEHLAEHAGLLVCCDISPNCLDACRQRLAGRGRLRTHVSDGDDLPGDLSGQVSAVWSYDCFVHVDPVDFERYLREIARVLSPGGVAVLHHADRGAGGAYPPLPERHGDHGWRSACSRQDVAHWAEAAGLVVSTQESAWVANTPEGPLTIGVPRFADCISVLRRPTARIPWRSTGPALTY